MRLLFARHGETDWNVAGRIQGSADIALNENGRAQAVELAQKIRDMRIPDLVLYSSPQKRAFETARIVAERVGAPLSAKNGFEEISFGNWEGLSWNEIERVYPREYARWRADRRYDKSHGGESYEEMLRRAGEAVRSVVASAVGTPLIVSHGGVILALKCIAFDMPFSQMHRYRLGNAEVVTFESETLLGKLPEPDAITA